MGDTERSPDYSNPMPDAGGVCKGSTLYCALSTEPLFDALQPLKANRPLMPAEADCFPGCFGKVDDVERQLNNACTPACKRTESEI